MKRWAIITAIMVALAAAAAAAVRAQQGSFDKLSAADRQAFQERFAKDIWPLLQRNGKNGCVGCHSGKIVSALHLTGQVERDFPMLLREGFFIPDDAGSLLGRITDKDPERRMPRSKVGLWTDAETKLLAQFVADLDKKQRN
ncbi:MAG: hypothetical protein L0Y71_18860 [Gemmataceae bacterium]|nr:hypothetical protein [Gemmataceae bacterium]